MFLLNSHGLNVLGKGKEQESFVDEKVYIEMPKDEITH